uniref:Uncharacterized protein n=1 Tax=Ananas comosus var. bracteatus TaxID=296719 RepID=A0A6V7PHM0_ANACO|nr:unnamed protein product [Ananas comosus var. bracteatus]
MGPLVELLNMSSAETRVAAALLIASICEVRENWGRAFKEKAGIAALHAMMEGDDPVKEAVPILHAVRSCSPIFDEALCELVRLHGSVDAPKWASLGMEIIEATTDETKPTIVADHANVEIAEVLWWLQNRATSREPWDIKETPRITANEEPESLHLIFQRMVLLNIQ